MILFHHRAVEARLAKLVPKVFGAGWRGWNRIRLRSESYGGQASIRDPQCGSAVLRLDDPAGRNGVLDWWSSGLMGHSKYLNIHSIIQ